MCPKNERVKSVHPKYQTDLVQLLTSVRFDQTSPDGMIYVGRAISMNVRLSTTYKWAEVLSASSSSGGDAKEKAVEGGTSVVFDVVANSEDWVVLGKKKGFYIAEVGVFLMTDLVTRLEYDDRWLMDVAFVAFHPGNRVGTRSIWQIVLTLCPRTTGFTAISSYQHHHEQARRGQRRW